jgi:hypothetical protein
MIINVLYSIGCVDHVTADGAQNARSFRTFRTFFRIIVVIHQIYHVELFRFARTGSILGQDFAVQAFVQMRIDFGLWNGLVTTGALNMRFLRSDQ